VTAPTPVADPTRIGPYLVERKLGSGGMGTVYLATHEQTGRIVALKLLSPSLAREEGLVARFMREIAALQKLKNPHVVELFDHGVDGDMYYYAMEYVPGETLTARLRREKRIPWREMIDLSIEICVALKSAHDAGIIHRDLKPSNLLLTPDGNLKLTDFGVAQVFAGSKLTVTGGIIGTAEYMSPEQGQGRRITKRSDLYALGAVMYVMLTGRPPFTGKTTLDVIHKHKYNQFDRPRTVVPEIPYWLDEIVCQLMEKDPEKRPADAFVVNRRLQEVLKKVEIANSEQTLGGGTQNDASTFNAAGASNRSGSAGAPGGHGTLMRDLFRAEIEAEQKRGGWRRLFENTWVLVGLLAVSLLVIAYGVVSSRARNVEPTEESSGETASWRREPRTELERVVGLARHQHDDGDVAGAERTLLAFAALLPEQSPERARVDKLVAELRARIEEHPRDLSFVVEALDRADKLLAAGKGAEARTIWSGVIALYGDDERAAADVERARLNLEATKGLKPASASKQGATAGQITQGQTTPGQIPPVQPAPSGSTPPGAAAKSPADKMGP
jgi:serine/threonine protein kinase